MTTIDNQNEYWDKVASQKKFTHPLRQELLKKHFSIDDNILDFGCGYGRVVEQLLNSNYKNIKGYDTSRELIERGTTAKHLPIYHINAPHNLPMKDNSIDSCILFAVLTCIPSNKGQEDLINILHSKLKPNGILYISDYYLQNDSTEMDRYQYLNNDKENYGVFTLKEGVTFRHHTQDWIQKLLAKFSIIEEQETEVMTMNKNKATCFQIIAKK